ncbi:MAG: precorrin-3B C(17)-methyltransferase, partial [Firmicutes bacterium]|nr:precorrin-3B C(17)-methyltransferase [Bacillota bacterium]
SYPDKEFFDNGMRQEADRCREALKMASEGKNVALVCSGDSCVYGMAGLVYELAPDYDNVEVSAIPGVTAALSGSAVLGAALGHDFAVISLSDLLTPWELIEKRLDACSSADMCIALYNPGSHKRTDYLQKACDIMLKHKAPETVCGTVNNIGREGEKAAVMTLAELRDTVVDMFTTVFIGNSATKIIDGKMITPRGYRIG